MAPATHSSDSHPAGKALPSSSSGAGFCSAHPSSTHVQVGTSRPWEARSASARALDDGESHSEAAPNNAGAVGCQNSGFQNATEENTNVASAGCLDETRVSSSTSSTRAENGSVHGGQAPATSRHVKDKTREKARKPLHIQPPFGRGLLQGVGTNFPRTSQSHTGYPYPEELVLSEECASEEPGVRRQP